MKKTMLNILLSFSFIFLWSCTEPYILQTETFENALVIEATLSDEYKYQEIKLSRTYKLEEDGPDMEIGAQVFVTDSNGNQYHFSESNGKYISQQEFKALPDVNYQLHIVTADGKTFLSTHEKLTSLTSIDEVTATDAYNSKGERGVQIHVKSNASSDETQYYRYTFEETNKVIAPQWVNKMGQVTWFNPIPNGMPYGRLDMVDWPYEAKTCYTTENSKEILLLNTSMNVSNNTSFPIQFIKATDYKIANRYSINVTLYNESLAAYNYYDALKKNSTNESILSNIQPGFYSGNIQNTSNPKEKVVGFFEVSHVTSKRIFFNFEEIFPTLPKPNYPYYCPEVTRANLFDFLHRYCFCYQCLPTIKPCDGNYILKSVYYRTKAVYDFIPPEEAYLVNAQCIDCTTFSSNIKPSFWID